MTNNDTDPILWINATGIDDPAEMREITDTVQSAVDDRYTVIVANKSIELIDREEILDALEDTHDPK